MALIWLSTTDQEHFRFVSLTEHPVKHALANGRAVNMLTLAGHPDMDGATEIKFSGETANQFKEY